MDYNDQNEEVFPSLTDGLQYVFETQGQTEFHIDAVLFLWSNTTHHPPPPKTFSLYGDE